MICKPKNTVMGCFGLKKEVSDEGQEEQECPGEILDFDEILDEIGPRGIFQIRTTIILWFCCATLNMTVLSFVFVAFTPRYRCPMTTCGESAATSSFYADSMAQAYPGFLTQAFGSNVLAKIRHCQQYQYPDQDSLTCEEYVQRLATDFDQANVSSCSSSDLIVDDSYVKSSMVIDYDFTCGQAFLKNVINSLYLVGMLVGSFIIGSLSDRFGRLKGLLISVFLVSVAGSLCALKPPLIVLGILRVLCGMGGVGSFICGYVIVVELVTPRYSIQMNMLISIGFAIGSIIVTTLSFLIREWQYLQLAIHAPLIILMSYGFLVPESPRWLISKGRHREAKRIIAQIAKVNGRPEPTHLYNKTNTVHTYHEIRSVEEIEKVSLWEVLNHRPLLLRTLVMMVNWFSVTMSFYGIIFTLTSLAGDPYLNFFLGILTELPGIFLVYFSVRFVGRRINMSFLMTFGGVSCIIAGISMGSNFHLSQRIFAFIAKLCAAAIFNSIFLYTTELYPTNIRNSALGSCSTIGRIGGVSALLLGGLSQIWVPLPLIVYGCIGIVAGFGTLFLPETSGTPLPETIEEALQVGKNSNFKPFRCNASKA
ncbi:solute carrier family 22 member 1-like [Tigriopus californicus]|uniref:solute carrier family 22 member 1-like n=1 Tax=Tigriopus californicus TaxID=6832 RepID=UPI0027DA2293|nr:solute carrier family 22 member 1-like [Tigriopus californicus]